MLFRLMPVLVLLFLLACETPVAAPDGGHRGDNPAHPQTSLVTALTSGVAAGYPNVSPPIRITTDPAEQSSPQVWGDLIVWQDLRHGNWDIYAFDLSTGIEFAITTDPADQMYPDVWNGVVVWQDHRNGNWDIYTYDVGTDVESRITSTQLDEDQPAIAADRLVFARDPNPSPGGRDIVLYELATGSEKVIREDWGQVPHIDPDRVVWADHGLRDAWGIAAYDLHTDQWSEVAADLLIGKYEPHVAGNLVAWNGGPEGENDIFLSDLATGQTARITTEPEFQCCAVMDGDIVTWDDHRFHIYFHDLGTGLQHLLTDLNGGSLSIFGHRIVWQGWNQEGATDIYLVELATQVEIDVKPGGDANSVNCNAEDGVVSVAILTTDGFDATSVDHATVMFEGAGEVHVDARTGDPRRHEEDVDEDGDMDLVMHFRIGDTRLTCKATQGTLTGETFDGTKIEGTDAVWMVG